MSFRTERRAARGRSLVLSRRPRHQARLLVHRRRQGKNHGKNRAGRTGDVATGGQFCFAAEQRQYAVFDRQCARRTAVAAVAHRAGNQRFHRAAPAGDGHRCDQPGQRPACNHRRCRRPGSVVASRWGELAGSSTQASPGPPTDNSAPANSGTAPTTSRAAPAPAKAVATLPLAAADASSTEKPAGSVQMLLIAILGALALAGLLASAIFRFSRPRAEQHSRRPARELGCGPHRSSVAIG